MKIKLRLLGNELIILGKCNSFTSHFTQVNINTVKILLKPLKFAIFNMRKSVGNYLKFV